MRRHSTALAPKAKSAAPENHRMFGPRKSQWLAVAALGLTMFSSQASAALVFTFQRVSDTKAIMSATGSVDDLPNQPTGLNDGTYRDLRKTPVLGFVLPDGTMSTDHDAATAERK